MARRKILAEMADALYEDPEVREAVINSCIGHGNQEAVETGVLHLPSETDAIHWHNRMTGRINETETESSQRKRIDALEKTLADYIKANPVPTQESGAELQKSLEAASK